MSIFEDRWAPWWSGAVTAIALVFAGAGGPSFLDSGELIASARELGGIHPPGHPAWLSIAPVADAIPWGAYGARVVWLSALFAGISVAFLTRIASRWLGAGLGLWSVAVGLTLGLSASLWQVGVRAEVYTLALASNLWALDAALRCASSLRRYASKQARGQAAEVLVAVCLGLLNHHYITLFLLPGLLVIGAPAARRAQRPARWLLWAIVMGLFVGLGYAMLPIRAWSSAEMRWADPVTIGDLWDTVTARHFQKSVTESNVDLIDNLRRMLSVVIEGIGPWLGYGGLLGVFVSLARTPRRGVMLALLLIGGLMTKGLMTVDPRNPDDHGYVLMAVSALALGLAELVRVVFGDEGWLSTLAPTRRRRLAKALAPLVMVTLVLTGALRTTSAATWQADQHGADLVDDRLRQDLAPGALYLANYYGLHFNEAAWRVAEGRRPDVVVAHLSFRTGDTDGGRGFRRWFTAQHPELAGLAVAAQKLKRAPIGNLLQVADGGYVFAEQDPELRLPPAVMGFNGVAHRLLPAKERSLEYDLSRRRQRQAAVWTKLYDQLGPLDALDHQTKSVLIWQHALQLAHALRRGWRTIARDELTRAQKIAPADTMLRRLEQRLELLDGAWADGDLKRFQRRWRGYSEMTLDQLVAPQSGR